MGILSLICTTQTWDSLVWFKRYELALHRNMFISHLTHKSLVGGSQGHPWSFTAQLRTLGRGHGLHTG